MKQNKSYRTHAP